jgi:hypothetical protein
MSAGGRVPFEYIGLARRLYRLVEAEQRTVKPAQDRLVATLEALAPRRGFRTPTLRPTLRQFATAWRDLPATAQLALKLVEAGDHLSLAEIRVLPSKMRMEGLGRTRAGAWRALDANRVRTSPPKHKAHPPGRRLPARPCAALRARPRPRRRRRPCRSLRPGRRVWQPTRWLAATFASPPAAVPGLAPRCGTTIGPFWLLAPTSMRLDRLFRRPRAPAFPA